MRGIPKDFVDDKGTHDSVTNISLVERPQLGADFVVTIKKRDTKDFLFCFYLFILLLLLYYYYYYIFCLTFFFIFVVLYNFIIL